MSVSSDISRMDTHSRIIRYVCDEWKPTLKTWRVIDSYFVPPLRDGCFTVDLWSLSDGVFERKTQILIVNQEPADGGLVAEDFAL